MLPFTIKLHSGVPIHDQVVYAVKRAILSGGLPAGEQFPSIRKLGKELGINPNTAQRIVASLTGVGFLEIRPGIGSVVSIGKSSDPEARDHLLDSELERIVVEAKQLDLELVQIQEAVAEHWARLDAEPSTQNTSSNDSEGK